MVNICMAQYHLLLARTVGGGGRIKYKNCARTADILTRQALK